VDDYQVQSVPEVSPLYFWTELQWQRLQEAQQREKKKRSADAADSPMHFGTVGAVALERVGRPLQAVLLIGPVALVAILLYRLFRRWRYGAASRDLIEFTE